MAADKANLIEFLVADSAAFLKNVALQNIAKNIYTINEVVGEIKSAAVRQRLAVLPYEITFRVPSNESLHVVSEFAKKTGDFQSLSLVDLKVLALTYQLHKEKCGTHGLRSEPTKQVEVVDKSPQGKVPGFYVKSKRSEGTNEDGKAAEQELALDSEKINLIENISRCSVSEKRVDKSNHNSTKDDAFKNEQEHKQARTTNDIAAEEKERVDLNDIQDPKEESGYVLDTIDNSDQKNQEEILNDGEDQVNDCRIGDDDTCDDNDVCHQDNDDDVNDDCDDDDDDDGGDWITPDNINQLKADYGISDTQSKPTDIAVGCLTTDFAMQNVLIQMGLHVISVEGMLIKEARSYVLKCYSCFKVTTEMQRMFCPKCGNRTLVKVSVSVNEEGITRYHMPKRNKPFSIRGKKHPLPLPKGGRHNKNPLLFEDQLISQRRLPRAKDKVNVFDEDYVARSSPFAVNDTTSRAFNLGFHVRGQNKRNPNEARKKTRRKK